MTLHGNNESQDEPNPGEGSPANPFAPPIEPDYRQRVRSSQEALFALIVEIGRVLVVLSLITIGCLLIGFGKTVIGSISICGAVCVELLFRAKPRLPKDIEQ